MAVAADDSIYTLHQESKCSTFPCTTELVLTRHIPSGSADPSFGDNGRTSVFGVRVDPFGRNPSLALGADGTVVVSATERRNLYLSRVAANGALDNTFGSGGIVKIDLGAEIQRTKVVVQGDGAIVVAAEISAVNAGETTVSIVRITSVGGLDAGFNGGVPVVTGLGSGIGALAVLPDGGVAFAGPGCCASSGGRSIQVGRLTSAGAFDDRFADRGRRFVDDVAGGAHVAALLTLSDDKLLVVGSGANRGDVFMLRLRADGRLDRRFGRGGIRRARTAGLSVIAAEQDDRKRLVIVGRDFHGGYNENRIGILRRRPNGQPDRTFGGGSVVKLDPRLAPANLIAFGLQSADRIVALVERHACSRVCPSRNGLLVRYIGGTSRTKCFGQRATIVGTRGAETLRGTPRRDVIAALAGNDMVLGRDGNDLICGGRGGDRLRGGDGRDRVRQ